MASWCVNRTPVGYLGMGEKVHYGIFAGCIEGRLAHEDHTTDHEHFRHVAVPEQP